MLDHVEERVRGGERRGGEGRERRREERRGEEGEESLFTKKLIFLNLKK